VHWQAEFDDMADGRADVFVKQVGSGWDIRDRRNQV
jgi:hypothetical protein